MLHDGDLQRVAGASQAQPVTELTAVQAMKIDAGSWFGPQFAEQCIPTLAAVLQRYRNRTHLHVVSNVARDSADLAIDWVVQPICSYIQSNNLGNHIIQELKSQQPGLPAAVAEALQAAGWLENTAVSQGGTAADAFAAPGLTITSFHIEQLRRSLQAGGGPP